MVTIDEYIISQVCTNYKTVSTDYEVDTSGAEINPVLGCTYCNTQYNRNHASGKHREMKPHVREDTHIFVAF
jgi:hypothetical protein